MADEQDTYETVTVERDGGRPYRGQMVQVGDGESGSGGTSGYRCDWTRGVRVHIWRRERGGYVVQRERWSCWQGEHGETEAWLVPDANALLASLQGEDGQMRRAEQGAWEDACEHDDACAALRCEEV